MAMNRYWATSKDMRTHHPKKLEGTGWWIEYNPNIKMYRANKKGEIPPHLMGYENNKYLLVERVARII